MKSKVDLIVFLELLASLYELLASLYIKYTYAFRNLGGNYVNMDFRCDVFINKLSAQYVVILYRYYFLVLFYCSLFRCTSHVPLFRGIPIFPPVFRCSTSAPVFRLCSVFRSSVFWCSWFYSMLINLYFFVDLQRKLISLKMGAAALETLQ